MFEAEYMCRRYDCTVKGERQKARIRNLVHTMQKTMRPGPPAFSAVACADVGRGGAALGRGVGTAVGRGRAPIAWEHVRSPCSRHIKCMGLDCNGQHIETC